MIISIRMILFSQGIIFEIIMNLKTQLQPQDIFPHYNRIFILNFDEIAYFFFITSNSKLISPIFH